MWNRLSLRWRLTLLYTLLLVLFLVSLYGVVHIALDRYLVDDALIFLKNKAKPINRTLEEELAEGMTFEEAAEYLHWLASGPESLVILMDSEGRVLAEPDEKHKAVREVRPERMAAALAGEKDIYYITRLPENGDERWLVMLHWIHIDKESYGVAQLSMPLTRADALLAQVRLIMAGGGLLIVLVAIVMGAPLVALATRPLEDVSHTARRIAAGDLSRRLPDRPGDSLLHQVSGVFNEMLDRLQGVAAENARLYQESRQKADTLEMLVLEMHHRIKNNLQTVADLLELELMQGSHHTPEQSLQDSIARIKTIAAVHEYLSVEQTRLTDVRQVAQTVFPAAARSIVRPGQQIEIQVTGDALFLPSGKATSLVLALNELVTNALEHAFPAKTAGHVQVDFQADDGLVQVQVSDDGVGLPPGLEPLQAESLGLRITRSLVEKDLEGVLRFRNDQGAVAVIRFYR